MGALLRIGAHRRCVLKKRPPCHILYARGVRLYWYPRIGGGRRCRRRRTVTKHPGILSAWYNLFCPCENKMRAVQVQKISVAAVLCVCVWVVAREFRRR